MMEHFNSNHFFYNSFCLASNSIFKFLNIFNPLLILFFYEGVKYETLHINVLSKTIHSIKIELNPFIKFLNNYLFTKLKVIV